MQRQSTRVKKKKKKEKKERCVLIQQTNEIYNLFARPATQKTAGAKLKVTGKVNLRLLLARGANPNAANYIYTPLADQNAPSAEHHRYIN